MKTKIMIVLMSIFSATASADTYVRGHTRSDGTYVAPHYRSNANGSTLDNYSTKPNINPYTGQMGTKPAYPSTTPSYLRPYRPR